MIIRNKSKRNTLVIILSRLRCAEVCVIVRLMTRLNLAVPA
jgi:hypothetical protein